MDQGYIWTLVLLTAMALLTRMASNTISHITITVNVNAHHETQSGGSDGCYM